MFDTFVKMFWTTILLWYSSIAAAAVVVAVRDKKRNPSFLVPLGYAFYTSSSKPAADKSWLKRGMDIVYGANALKHTLLLCGTLERKKTSTV